MKNLEGLDDLSSEGQQLLDMNEPVEAHKKFNYWITSISRWLNQKTPNSGLKAEWLSQGKSDLVVGGCYYDGPVSWHNFHQTVQRRLLWLSNLPTKVSNKKSTTNKEPRNLKNYVDTDRIEELLKISSKECDLTKLICLCKEINICFTEKCYFSVIMSIRAIIDHVPPIFYCSKFSEVANNYSGSKSFKESMKNLENSSRKIADQHLHCQIRSSEIVPTKVQVDFSNDLDVLLGEIVRLLKN